MIHLERLICLATIIRSLYALTAVSESVSTSTTNFFKKTNEDRSGDCLNHALKNNKLTVAMNCRLTVIVLFSLYN